MAITIGQRLGSFEVVSLLGRGGMGEVYQARDTQLQRDVALKLLPDAFASDPERLARFQREAQVLAALNHPNIAQIYGLEGAGLSRCIVMELVDGETLQERLKRGSMPVEEALAIAKQIAEALEAAHEKDIIHRDLKPANVKITPDGRVKVLDFGLAKPLQEVANRDFSNSPTLSMAATNAGVILGTAAYMSPEQARGENTDERSDVFSFGCVLYEMFTGQQAFQGKTVSDILAGVLRVEPDFALLPQNLNARLHEVLHRCLDKNPKNRWQAVGDLRIEIAAIISKPLREIETAHDAASKPRTRERFMWISATAILALIVVVTSVLALRPTPAAPEMQFEITTPPAPDPTEFAISPDGQKLVFVASPDGQPQLWLRSLDSLSAMALKGTERAQSPFWSPDSRSIGFFADDQLKRIDVDGGVPQTLSGVLNRGGTWGTDGNILLGSVTGPIRRIRETGGEIADVTRREPPQTTHTNPHMLPDGKHFLFWVGGPPGVSGVYVTSIEGRPLQRLVDASSGAVYSSGYIFFNRQGTLLAQRFDVGRLHLSGTPLQVADQLARRVSVAASVSANGLLAYRSGSGAENRRQFEWLDRSGKTIGKVSSLEAIGTSPELSPDGRWVALQRSVKGNNDTWLIDTERNVSIRLTSDPANDTKPIWSPDGRQIAFHSNRKGKFDIYRKAVNGGSDELLLEDSQNKTPLDWSFDAHFILYGNGETQDIWALPLGGDRKPFPVVQTPFDEGEAQFSPDGKWIAYESNESGQYELYVQPFPGPGGKWRISTNGGAQVRWNRNGKELFYIALDGRLMSVPIALHPDGNTLDAQAPLPLFLTHLFGGPLQGSESQAYMVSPDGQRFLMNNVLEEMASPITVIINWHPKQ